MKRDTHEEVLSKLKTLALFHRILVLKTNGDEGLKNLV